MNLLVITFGSSFTESMLYKEHVLIKQALKNGINVTVLAHTSMYDGEKKILLKEGSYVSNSGYLIIRREYKKYLLKYLTDKIRKIKGFVSLVSKYNPDILFINTPQIYNIKELCEIKEVLPNIKIFTMFTTTYDNSGKNIFSKIFLHKFLYRKWLKKAYPYFDSIFYAAEIVRDFIVKEYKTPKNKMKFLSLSSQIIPKVDKENFKLEIRKRHLISNETLIFSHSGKMNKNKRTLELIEVFSFNKDLNAILFLIGTFSKEIKLLVEEKMLNDPRIIHIPFVSGDSLIKYLCATDLYFQPGSVSQTAQTTICCGTPIVVYKHSIYDLLIQNNGFLISNINELQGIFRKIQERELNFKDMSNKSYEIAEKYLSGSRMLNTLLES